MTPRTQCGTESDTGFQPVHEARHLHGLEARVTFRLLDKEFAGHNTRSLLRNEAGEKLLLHSELHDTSLYRVYHVQG